MSSTAIGGLALVAAAAVARPAEAVPKMRCERIVFSVAVADGMPADQQVVGWLCSRKTIQHRTIQILLHGGGYDHNYWDFPYQPETYSYVRALTAAGYTTLDLDRLGSGQSSHPPWVTLQQGAYAVHQIVQTLRSGTLLVPGFGHVRGERIMLVGHSLGSFIASIEAATYNDVAGAILSGINHIYGPAIPENNNALYPAYLNPKFASLGLTPDYMTLLPGTLAELFYHIPGADPAVIAMDEQLVQTVNIGELSNIPAGMASSQNVQVPVLLINGDYDFYGCFPPSCTASGWLNSEPSNFPPESCPEAVLMPDTGHDLNLHLSAPNWFLIAREWSDRRVGVRSNKPPRDPCQ